MEVVKVLVEKGADINKAMNDGFTPLLMASLKGHVEVVGVLVENGADINKANNDGYTPLIIAEALGHSEIVALLESHSPSTYTIT